MDIAALGERAQLALDTINGRGCDAIPTWSINPMEHCMIDRIAGVPEGTYTKYPEPTYRQMLVNTGCCMVDQYIPLNPLTMGSAGYEADAVPQVAGVGGSAIQMDGMLIDSPEAVVGHIETVLIPRLRAMAHDFNEDACKRGIIEEEKSVQSSFGADMLKAVYAYALFPTFEYTRYGYESYFAAYGLYPDVIERLFAAQADYAALNNRAVLHAIREGGLPPFIRLDHDMADSRGTLVNIRSLDQLWFPHFVRALRPLLESEVKLIWHCDGNLSQMVPRLLDIGLKGFQGFQYEDGIDYLKICRMKTRTGEPLLIFAGVSVTRTLPNGTPDDVRREMAWLVDNGPRHNLFLGTSSSITPGVRWENLQALIEGFHYYRTRLMAT